MSFDKAFSQPVISDKITFSTKKAHATANNSYITIEGTNLELDKNQIYYTEDQERHAYTFRLRDQTDADRIVNLFLTSTDNGENFQSYLIDYDLTEDEQNIIKEGDNVDLTGKVFAQRFIDIEESMLMSGKDCIDADFEYIPCSSGNHPNNEGSCSYLPGGANEGKGIPPILIDMSIYASDCPDSPGSSGGGGGGPSGIGDGNSGTGNGVVSGGNDSSNNNGYESPGGGNSSGNSDSGVTLPLLDVDYDNFQFNQFVKGLPEDLQDLLEEDEELKDEIFDFLTDSDGYSAENEEFAKEALEAIDNNGDVDWVYGIIFDKSFKNNDCLSGVYDNLGMGPACDDFLKYFEDEMSVAQLTFAAANLPDPPGKKRYATTNHNDCTLQITFNLNHLDRPPLSIARTFLHELIHADMYRILMEAANSTIGQTFSFNEQDLIDNKEDFVVIKNYMDHYNMVYNGNGQHELMGENFSKYRTKIANILADFDNNAHDPELYDALAWMGLEGTDAWNALEESNTIKSMVEDFEEDSDNQNCQ